MYNFCLMAKVLCIVNQSDEWLDRRMPLEERSTACFRQLETTQKDITPVIRWQTHPKHLRHKDQKPERSDTD